MGDENRHFSREFKRDAVQLVTEKGMPVGKVAREARYPSQSSSFMEEKAPRRRR